MEFEGRKEVITSPLKNTPLRNRVALTVRRLRKNHSGIFRTWFKEIYPDGTWHTIHLPLMVHLNYGIEDEPTLTINKKLNVLEYIQITTKLEKLYETTS